MYSGYHCVLLFLDQEFSYISPHLKTLRGTGVQTDEVIHPRGPRGQKVGPRLLPHLDVTQGPKGVTLLTWGIILLKLAMMLVLLASW
jgi:hypothetical protein